MGPPDSIRNAPFSIHRLFLPSAQKNISFIEVEAVKHSKVLNEVEKKYFSQMISCVGEFGVENFLEIFNAAGHCCDLSFGPNSTPNIIFLSDFVALMGGQLKSTLEENDCISADFFALDRPGFFIISERTIYFLKKASDGSLVHYDSTKDNFVESNSLPIAGNEVIVVLNKTNFPEIATYSGLHTPEESIEGKFYHEIQDGFKCTIHAVHAFLGFPIVNKTQLSLSRLEQATDATYHLDIENFYLQSSRPIPDLNLMPRGQITHFKNLTRFNLAQAPKLYDATLGNQPENFLLIFKQMADQGLIDKKYSYASIYSITLLADDLKYAKEKGLIHHVNEWNLDLPQRLLDSVNLDLEKIKATSTPLEHQQRVAKRQKRDPDCINMSEVRSPYDVLEDFKERLLNKIIPSIQRLRTEFVKSERLLVSSHNEFHSFAMRKDKNGNGLLLIAL